MVIYDLICSAGHQFEGWFPGHETFESQCQKGLIQCNICGDTKISKVPSGGHFLASSPSKRTETPHDEAKTTKASTAATPLDVVSLSKMLRHYVTTNFENVGERFATLARKMHNGEVEHKNIYGQTSPKEREELAEEEIPHFVIPELPPEYDN